jgi:hypothetical protein
MKISPYWLIIAYAVCASSQAQQLYKCSTDTGATEYRNSPCEKGQRSAGPVNKGTVTAVTSSAPSDSAAGSESTLSKLGLEVLANPIKAMRDDAAPLDAAAINACKNDNGFYVEGAGCMSEAPKNRNPLIGAAKMREICKKTNQTYVKALNDCVAVAKK